ncbi:MAG: DUF4129 domain-containing protein [Methanomicrobiales archaeon]|nr:DUF4129 domain-containing protein [Methanomicrobiales archaeon]
MNHRALHTVLAVAVITALILLAGEATTPLLYTATNTSTAAHVDPATVPKLSDNDPDALIPLMEDLLGKTGTLTLNIKLKDYESAERDLARYAELSGRFAELVINLDISRTDIGEFQRNNQENLAALGALLDDARRFEDLQRVEIQIKGDEGQRAAVIYEGEVLQQKLQGGAAAYAGREDVTIRIADRYGVNATPYRESVRNYAEIVGATVSRQAEAGESSPSPLSITVTPDTGRYGDSLSITGTYTGGTAGTLTKAYVDSQIAGNAILDESGTYACSYRVDRIPAGLHLAYTVADVIHSNVATFEIRPDDTTITLTLEEDRVFTVCTGNLTTAGGRPVTLAPILLRVDGDTPITTETDENGTYREVISLPAGEHIIKAEFDAVGYPLSASESPGATVIVPSGGLSPFPFIAAIATALGSGWYLRRRHRPKEVAPAPEPVETVSVEEEAATPPLVDLAGLPPREAATVLFYALRSRLGLPEAKTPRDCAQLAPAHAGFFERYEQIRYAGETPSEEELRAMKEEALGGEEHAA